MDPEWSRVRNGPESRAWTDVLRPVAGELIAGARDLSVQVTDAIGLRLPELLRDPESFEASRASSEASILGFAQVLELGADPAGASLGAATLAYTQEAAQRGTQLTTLMRSYRLGHAAAWEAIAPMIAAHARDAEQRAVATDLCSSWLFAYVDSALCLAEDFYSAERERWMRSAAAVRAETIATLISGGPIDAAVAGRRLGYALDREHIAMVAWLEAHEEGRDSLGVIEAAIATISDRLGAARVLVHPLGTLSAAGWLGTHDPIPSRLLDELRLDTAMAPGVRVAVGESGHGIAGFRSSHAEAVEARRVAELAGRPPGSVTRYSGVALAAIATTDLEQTRTFVRRELRGLADDEDLAIRLAATLRTYLEEQSSRSRTASRLGVHQNTVSYRIRQVEEVLGRTVDHRTLELRMALALLRYVRGPRS